MGFLRKDINNYRKGKRFKVFFDSSLLNLCPVKSRPVKHKSNTPGKMGQSNSLTLLKPVLSKKSASGIFIHKRNA